MSCLVGKTRIHFSVTAFLFSRLFVVPSMNGVKMMRLDVYYIDGTVSVIKSEHTENITGLFMMYFHDSFQIQITQTFCVLEQFLESRV